MALIGANELKRKILITLDGQPYIVLEVTFASPSARGASTMVKARVRNLLTGAVLDKNFKAAEKFSEPDVEKITASFLYADPDACFFMEENTFEQFPLANEKIADLKGYLKESMIVEALKYNGQIISIQLPVYVELKVTSCEPTKGDSGSSNATKQGVLETGLEVRMPLYIKEGDTVRVNTQTREVAGRA